MKNPVLACNLSDPEFRLRKKNVLQMLKRQILYRKELQRGFVFYFPGDEEMFETLVTFIRVERKCCPFLHFHLRIIEADVPLRLKISGPSGAKDFIVNEL